jgi:hypothetical protein
VLACRCDSSLPCGAPVLCGCSACIGPGAPGSGPAAAALQMAQWRAALIVRRSRARKTPGAVAGRARWCACAAVPGAGAAAGDAQGAAARLASMARPLKWRLRGHQLSRALVSPHSGLFAGPAAGRRQHNYTRRQAPQPAAAQGPAPQQAEHHRCARPPLRHPPLAARLRRSLHPPHRAVPRRASQRGLPPPASLPAALMAR